MQRNTKPARECPLFPLTVNVLPGGFLPLQIFEPRYLDMISNCLGKEEGFSIVLLQAQVGGLQKDSIPNHFTVGTYVEVVDFNQVFKGLKLVGDYLEKSILRPNNISYPKSRIDFLNVIKK